MLDWFENCFGVGPVLADKYTLSSTDNSASDASLAEVKVEIYGPGIPRLFSDPLVGSLMYFSGIPK